MVDPSGSDNNFGFSVEDDNHLILDLTQGIDGNTWMWGASANLTDGITYTFSFHAMHADFLRYGAGGIGGPDIQFTPGVSSVYDIVFNDADDSYLIEHPDTDGPPSIFTAQSGCDAHVSIIWQTPGAEDRAIGYNDGINFDAYYYYSKNDLTATMFVPGSYPLVIDSVYRAYPDGRRPGLAA